MFTAWFVMGTSAYGLHLAVKYVPFDLFVLSAVKAPINAAGFTLMTAVAAKVDRAPLSFVLFLAGGLLTFTMSQLPETSVVAPTVLYFVALTTVDSAFIFICTYVQEIFSTDSRNFSFGTADSISKV